MEESMTSPRTLSRRPAWGGIYVLVIAIILLLLAGGFLVYRAWGTGQTPATQSSAEILSSADLEERYGLHVRLIGVTASGGMIDFRLKMIDPDKARQFLQDQANLPRLIVAESGEALIGTEELDEDVNWEEGGILFILFSNSGGAIQPGTPVIVEFGGVQLEPMPAQ